MSPAGRRLADASGSFAARSWALGRASVSPARTGEPAVGGSDREEPRRSCLTKGLAAEISRLEPGPEGGGSAVRLDEERLQDILEAIENQD